MNSPSQTQQRDLSGHSRLASWSAILAIMLAQLIFLLLLNQWEFFGDDACITFRYAQNLGWGTGFVYNPGEHVLGTTTPLYAMLLSFPVWLGMNVGYASRLINIIATIACTFYVHKITKRLSSNNFAAMLSSLIYVISPLFTFYVLNGMEYPLVSLAMLLMTDFLLERKRLAFGLVAAFALMLRVDLVPFVVIIYLTAWIKYRMFPIKELVITLLAYLPWLIFAFSYFGSPIPVTLSAKLVQFNNNISLPNNLEAMVNSMGMLLVPLPIYAVLALIGVIAHHQKVIVLTLAAWSCVYLLFNLILSPPFFPWYYLPLLTSLAILSGLGWRAITDFIKPFIRRKAIGMTLAFVIGLATVVITVPQWTGRFYRMLSINTYEYQIAKQAGKWCAANLPDHATLMSPAPGFEGIFTRIRILDLGCLVSPQLLKYFRGRSYPDASRLAIVAEKPDFLELFNPADPQTAVEVGYLPVKTFLYKGGKKERGIMLERTIYANPKSVIARELLELKNNGDARFQDEYLNE